MAALLIYPQFSAKIPPPPVHLSMYLFKKSPRHVAFHSLPALKHDVFGASSAGNSCSARDMLFPELRFHQPPTEPHTPHGPRLPGTEMLLGQMYRDTHINHAQTHSANTHTRAKAYHICPFSSLQRCTEHRLRLQQIQCHLLNHFLKL